MTLLELIQAVSEGAMSDQKVLATVAEAWASSIDFVDTLSQPEDPST